MTSIQDVSEQELHHILGFLSERAVRKHPPILVGGWAVYAYNPYAKSKDIDLVLSSRHRTSLVKWLLRERGYEPAKPQIDGWRGASKRIPDVGTMIVDIAGFRENHRFEAALKLHCLTEIVK